MDAHALCPSGDRSDWTDHVHWRGVLHEAHIRFAEAKSEAYRKKNAKADDGADLPRVPRRRLKPYPAATLLGGKRISESTHMTIENAPTFSKT